jgi:hypothetical protein
MAKGIWSAKLPGEDTEPKIQKKKTHAIPIPNFDDLFVRADNQTLTCHFRATFYPEHPFDSQAVPLVFRGEGLPGSDVVKQSVTGGSAHRVRETIGPGGQGGDGQQPLVVVIGINNTWEYRRPERPERDETRARQHEDAQSAPRSRIPKLDGTAPTIDPKCPESMRWVDIDGIDAGHGARIVSAAAAAAKDEGIQETALLEIETVHFVA